MNKIDKKEKKRMGEEIFNENSPNENSFNESPLNKGALNEIPNRNDERALNEGEREKRTSNGGCSKSVSKRNSKKKEKKKMSEKKQRKFIRKVMDSISMVGECRCGGHLFISIKSNKREMFNVYCTGCGSVSDIRFPKGGDTYFIKMGESSSIELLMDAYKAHDKTPPSSKDIEEVKISSMVNEIHGGF